MKSPAYTKTHSFHVSKTIHAPLRFVYEWCTDYSETDPQITGSESKRRILLRTKHRVVYMLSYPSRGKIRTGINVVTLHPPNGWHLDFVGDEDNETGDYSLTTLGAGRTRLDMKFTERYKIPHAPSKLQDTKHVHEVWDKYIGALEKNYFRSR